MKLHRTLSALVISSLLIAGSAYSQSLPNILQRATPTQIEGPVPPAGLLCDEVLLSATDEISRLTRSLAEGDIASAAKDARIAEQGSSIVALQAQVRSLERSLSSASVRKVILDITPTSQKITKRIKRAAKGHQPSFKVARRLLNQLRASVAYNNQTLAELGFPIAQDGNAGAPIK